MLNIFSEYEIKNLKLKNRIVMPPMCMYVAPETGMVTDWHVIHYATRAVGGTGLIIVEATAIAPEGRISAKDLGIWEDAHIPGLARIVNSVHENGAKIGIQLNHAGRKCTVKGMEIEAPSPIPYDEQSEIPKEMTKTDIDETVDEFRRAAIRANKAGFDLLQIHAAHGYLLSEFLSPLTNNREDEYGGSYENRVRFLGDVLAAVKSVWPEEKPIEVRISAEDYGEGGNQSEDLAEMLNLIKDKGIDSVNVSTGGVISVVPKAFPGYQVRHAEIIKRLTGLPVVAGGILSGAEEVYEIIVEKKADQIFLGRELLRNPYWPLHAARVLGIDIEWPEPYKRAKPRDK
ncbi:MAG: NADPH dehydrogenase NamA [Anaerovoracaceae bacterium]|jgi:NADPH2 dehydrogenase